MSAPAIEHVALKSVEHFIDGKRTAAASSRWGLVYDPARGVSQAQVALADSRQVDMAVASALQAFPKWAEMTPLRRARVLFRYKDLLDAQAGELADIIVSEHGKVRGDALGEVTRGIEVVEFACGIPHLLKGEFSDQVGAGIDSWSLRQPVGVCVGITPFNFPFMVPLWMFPLAVACGNTFVLKPSDRDPSASIRLAELFIEAGGPPGVVNVLNGDSEAVNALIRHKDVSAISFVGSTPIAQSIYAVGCEHHKRVQALGGAKNHGVVMPDADLERTATAISGAAFGSAGERCMALSVVVAVGSIADPLVARLTELARTVRVGAGTDPASEMGPLVTAEHRSRVAGYVARGVSEGADLTIDGREHEAANGDGFFLGATIFDNVSPAMSIYSDEIFGPVLSVVRVPDFEAAVNLINGNRYGNGVSVFTSSGRSAREFVRRVQVGMVGVNVPIPVPMAYHSFGGWKQSLFGDHAVHGADGVHFYTRTKTVTASWPEGSSTANEMHMPTQ
jgi:malonate-semialdehyde dehydrogenase (acetylating)/methylmalonate-semialdehyde dehydrogenase